MSPFDCLNDEVFLENESYAFYTATNTFRNPIFNCSTNNQDLLDGVNICEGDQDSNNNAGHRTNSQARGSQKKSENKASKSASSKFVLLINHTKEKCCGFCDNFAFSLRDKLFIMETNFKRRLRQLTRFMNKRLGPHWRQSSTITMGRNQEGAIIDSDEPASELERNGQQEFRASSNRREKRRQLFNLTEPLSAEALGMQQERILNRLECMKRANQRLVHSSSSSSSAAESKDDNKGQDGSGATRRRCCRMPKSASSSGGNSNGSQTTVPVWLRSDSSDEAADWPRSRSFSNTGPEQDDVESQVGACDLTTTTTSQLDAGKATPRPTAAEEATTGPIERSVASKSKKAATSGRWSSISSGIRRQTKFVKTRIETDSADDEKKICIVCYERPPNILTLPCEHCDICSDCFIEIIYMAVKNSQYPLRCVLCRQKVERIRCSRRLMLSVIKRNRTKSANNSLLSL